MEKGRIYKNAAHRSLVGMFNFLVDAGRDQRTARDTIWKIKEQAWRLFCKNACFALPMSFDIDAMREGRENDSEMEKVAYADLYAAGVDFKFQEKIGPYRVDFLVGGWLVVEFDGPDHRHPEAIRRDRKRDKYFIDRGYSVYRIPWDEYAFRSQDVINEIATLA